MYWLMMCVESNWTVKFDQKLQWKPCKLTAMKHVLPSWQTLPSKYDIYCIPDIISIHDTLYQPCKMVESTMEST